MKTFQIVILALLFLSEIVLTPIFSYSMFPKKTNKSLFLKMICSSIFLLTGVLAKAFTANTSIYATLLIIAFCLSWVGDLMLGLNGSKVFFAVGGVFFMITHLLFIVSFTLKAKQLVPSLNYYGMLEFSVSAIFVAFFEIYNKKKNISLGKYHIPVLIYAVLLSSCVSKAYILMKNALMTGVHLASVTVFAGAVLFMISDFTLTYTILDESKKEDKEYKLLNSLSYFSGQFLIALSILFIK